MKIDTSRYYFSNCLVYALSRRLEFPNSRIGLEWSLRPFNLHWYWIAGDDSQWHFVRHSKVVGGVKHLWFKGRVKQRRTKTNKNEIVF